MQRLLVEEDREPIIARVQRECMPLLTLDLDSLGARKLLTLSVTDAVETNVAFERVGTRYVVVTGIGRAHDHAAGLVGLSGHRLAARCDLDIGGSDGLVHRHQKPEIRHTGRQLRKCLAAARSGICDYLPAAWPALASESELEVSGRLPRRLALECHDLGRRCFAAREPCGCRQNP